MAEAFGRDTRIDKLGGRRPAAFYLWDLECLYDVTDLTKPELPPQQHEMIDALLKKLEKAMESIQKFK